MHILHSVYAAAVPDGMMAPFILQFRGLLAPTYSGMEEIALTLTIR